MTIGTVDGIGLVVCVIGDGTVFPDFLGVVVSVLLGTGAFVVEVVVGAFVVVEVGAASCLCEGAQPEKTATPANTASMALRLLALGCE